MAKFVANTLYGINVPGHSVHDALMKPSYPLTATITPTKQRSVFHSTATGKRLHSWRGSSSRVQTATPCASMSCRTAAVL